MIVLEVSMPWLNGMDTRVQVRRRRQEGKLVFLTVNEDPYLAAKAIRPGASGYLLNSSATNELLTAIEYGLLRKRA